MKKAMSILGATLVLTLATLPAAALPNYCGHYCYAPYNAGPNSYCTCDQACTKYGITTCGQYLQGWCEDYIPKPWCGGFLTLASEDTTTSFSTCPEPAFTSPDFASEEEEPAVTPAVEPADQPEVATS